MMIENIVYSGSGSLLPAFAGGTTELFKKTNRNDIKRICATSGGSIYAFLLIINNMDEQKVNDIIMNMEFKKFFDNSFGYIRDTWRLIFRGGWNEGEEIIKFLSDELLNASAYKTLSFSSFKDIFGIDFTVIVTNADTGETEYCNSMNTPHLSVVEAVRRSMSIPLVFIPRRDQNGTYIDGGVLNNFAIQYYDHLGNPERTLGFCLTEGPKQIIKTQNNLIGIVGAVRRCLLRSQKDTDTSCLNRTIAIHDCGLSGLDPLDNNKKTQLMDSGKIAFLRWLNETNINSKEI